MAYNLKWVLERGMFVDPIKFGALGDVNLNTVHTDFRAVHVAGIDLGKSSDSTVITIVEVDFTKPVIVEKSQDLNSPDFVVYETTVKNWVEILGDDYEVQYHQIMDVLKNYNMHRLVIDATAVGSPIADRLSANLPYEVIPYVFGTQSKSHLYKHYDGEIKSGRFKYPASPEVKETREYRKFEKQHIDLQKGYSGQYLVVGHPDERGAHDDYPDSTALAVWGERGEGVAKPVMEDSPFKEIRQIKSPFYNARNSITARRR